MTMVCTKEAARMLGLAEVTLKMWRSRNKSPVPFVRVGKAVRYSVESLREYIARNTITQ